MTDGAPTQAWVVTVEGEQVACLLEQTGPNEWQAVPVRDLSQGEVASVYVDQLPGRGGSISFLVGDRDG